MFDTKQISQNRKDYSKFLKGKRIVVVGPAPTIVGSKQHDLIDSYDIVVRLNRALPIPEHLKEDIGERTDVLYNCMNPSNECGGKIDIHLLESIGVKFLVSPYAPIEGVGYRFKKDIDAYWKKNGNSFPFCYFDEKYFLKLLKIMKLPNTGINAILDLLHHDIAELYITGFTFFKGGYMKEYRGYSEQEVLKRMARFNLHDQEKQLKHMRGILSKDPRVKMDNPLAEIIKEDSKVTFKIKDTEVVGEGLVKSSGLAAKTQRLSGRHKIERKYVRTSSRKDLSKGSSKLTKAQLIKKKSKAKK